ncbi:hypothetical protein PHMEG_00015351 [Phytophthora megakarya]|uniref:Uncharacterized protein n=1 Tax=Phytophthora megakarya TaxID=4795 RepID=A0A225W330_9STRA|nr:hypothetical protein PHMEG_00015351 [Phytophthora megakarya]
MHQRNQAKERLLEEMLDAMRASAGTTYQRQQPELHTPETVINGPKEKARREMQELVYTPGPKQQRPKSTITIYLVENASRELPYHCHTCAEMTGLCGGFGAARAYVSHCRQYHYQAPKCASN